MRIHAKQIGAQLRLIEKGGRNSPKMLKRTKHCFYEKGYKPKKQKKQFEYKK